MHAEELNAARRTMLSTPVEAMYSLVTDHENTRNE